MLKTLLSKSITTALNGTQAKDTITLNGGMVEQFNHLALLAKFDYGSGGTSVKAYVQTSLDGGETWVDIACFTFATADASKVLTLNRVASIAASYTPLDSALGDDTAKDGILGDVLQVKLVTTGTYAATTLKVYATLN